MDDELKRWMETGEVTKLPPGRAYGSTKGGSICAGSWSSSLLSRSQAGSNWGRGEFSRAAKRNRRIEKKVAEARKFRKQHSGDLATGRQKDYAQHLGIPLPNDCSKRKARELIQAHLATRNFSK